MSLFTKGQVILIVIDNWIKIGPTCISFSFAISAYTGRGPNVPALPIRNTHEPTLCSTFIIYGAIVCFSMLFCKEWSERKTFLLWDSASNGVSLFQNLHFKKAFYKHNLHPFLFFTPSNYLSSLLLSSHMLWFIQLFFVSSHFTLSSTPNWRRS